MWFSTCQVPLFPSLLLHFLGPKATAPGGLEAKRPLLRVAICRAPVDGRPFFRRSDWGDNQEKPVDNEKHGLDLPPPKKIGGQDKAFHGWFTNVYYRVPCKVGFAEEAKEHQRQLPITAKKQPSDCNSAKFISLLTHPLTIQAPVGKCFGCRPAKGTRCAKRKR